MMNVNYFYNAFLTNLQIFVLQNIFLQMNRARTPFGAVPISTIYGYEYPLSNNTTVDFNKNESRNR